MLSLTRGPSPAGRVASLLPPGEGLGMSELVRDILFGVPLVRLLDEDEGRSGHNRRARTDKRDVDVRHLPLSRAPRRLQGALYDMPQSMDASGAETAAERVERQFPIELDPPVLDEIERLALLAETVRLQSVEDGSREA